MPTDRPSLLDLTPEQIRLRKREVLRRGLLLRRMPLLAWESLQLRLDGLCRRHPREAAFAQDMARRASELRLNGSLELARELEDAYLGHLAARGIAETWYDTHHDEAAILDRHFRAVGVALDRAMGVTPPTGPRPVTLRRPEDE